MSELAPPLIAPMRWSQRVEQVEDLARQAARSQVQFRLAFAAFAVEEHHDALSPEVVNSLALGLGLSPRQMEHRLGGALGLHQHPRLAGLVMDGTWLVEHADAVLAGFLCADLTMAQQEQVLDLLLARCRSRVPWELKKAVQAAVAVLFPELLTERAEQAKTDRDVRVEGSGVDGPVLMAWGPAQQVEAMLTVLDTMTFPPEAGDTRTAGQRRFDCLFALLTGEAEPSQWQVHVLTQLETLLGENEHPAETTGGQFLPAAVARELAAQGTLRRVAVDEHGQLVAVEAGTDRPRSATAATAVSPSGGSAAASSGGSRPGARILTDLEDDGDVELTMAEPDPDAPSAQDLAWFEDQQGWARIHDPLQAAPVTPLTTAEEPAGQTPDDLCEAAVSDREDSLTVRLQRLLARPFTAADLSSPGYRPNRALRRHLAVRDRTCRFPGCPNRICDLDHVTVWPFGPTSAENLARECERHHQAKHQYFEVRVLPDGALRWTDRGGRHFHSPVPTVLVSAAFHQHQRRDRRPGTYPPTEDRSEDP